MNAASSELEYLYGAGLIPYIDTNLPIADYSIYRYTVADSREPMKTASFYCVGYTETRLLSRMQNFVVYCRVDAESHKITGFAIRADKKWSGYDPGFIARGWCEYYGYAGARITPVEYELKDALSIGTRSFQKYCVINDDGYENIITIGFFDGINELFFDVG